MVLNSALSIRATIAGISADSVNTRPVRGTLRVADTTADIPNRFRRFARSASTAHVTIGTDTDHRTQWHRWHHFASRWTIAWLQGPTRIHASSIYAGQMRGAIAVQSAFRLWFWSTIHVWVTNHSRGTSADGHVIVRAAFGTSRAGVVVHARIDTLRVLALLLRWTVAVAATANHVTTLIRISSISISAATLSLIAGDITLAVLSARIVDQARINAHAVDTRFPGVTLGIRSTSHSSASGLRVALIARFAAAHGTMILDVALGVNSAITWISALSVYACLRSGAFRVALTTRFTLQHDLATLAIDIWHPKLGTFTDHRSNGDTVQHGALGRWITGRQFKARILAPTIEARHSVGTVWVCDTFGLVGHRLATFTIREWITQGRLFGTDTVRHVVTSVTLGVLRTWRVLGTGINTSAVSAGSTVWTIVVSGALDPATNLKWIALESRRTSAIGTMVMSIALCRYGTRIID